MSVFFVFYGLVNVLPLYVTGALHLGSEDAGMLLTVFLLSAILARPFTGKILDVVGKRKMLLISIFMYLITTILYIFIKPFIILLVLRFVQGLFFSVLTTANNAIAADIVPDAKKGQGLGYFAMSQNLAIVIGPFVALILVQYMSFDILFVVMSAVVLLGSLTALLMHLPQRNFPKGKPKLRFQWSDLIEKQAVPAALIGGFVAFSYAGILSYLSVYAQEKQLLGTASVFYLVFAAAMLITRPFTGKVFDTKGPKFIIIPGFILFAIGLIIMANMSNSVTFLLAGIFIGLGYGSLVPSLQTLCVQKASSHRTGYATATFFMIFDTGIAAGSALLGLIATNFGYEQLYGVAAMVLVFVCIFYSIRVWKQSTKKVIH